MKNKWRILKILVTVVLLGFLLSFSLKRFNNKEMSEKSISVHFYEDKIPVYFIEENTIKNLVKKQNPSGKVGDLKIPELEKTIETLSSVDSANVYLNLDGILNVDIKQKIPVFRLNKNERDFYVDEKGNEFPLSSHYSHPCMLVSGNVKETEYKKLADLVKKINEDSFCRKYFIGISKKRSSYYLLTSDGNFKVEIGDLDRIDFKVKGFKTFVEKYLVYQDPEKYNKISLRYDNQVVATYNPYYQKNDSILAIGNKQVVKTNETTKPKLKTQKVN